MWYPGQSGGGKSGTGAFGSPVAFSLTLELIFKSFARRSFLPLCYHPSVGGSGRGVGPQVSQDFSWFEHWPVHKNKGILPVATCGFSVIRVRILVGLGCSTYFLIYF